MLTFNQIYVSLGVLTAAFLTCQGETCSSGRLFFGSINETYPVHLGKIGVYVRLDNVSLFNHPVYRHESGAHYMYYRRGFINNGYWVVGPEIGSNSAAFSVESRAADPTLVRNTWAIQTQGGWVGERLLTARCVDETFEACSSEVLKVSGLSSPFSQFQSSSEGLYDLTDDTLNLRPVYRHRGNGEFLYHTGGMWTIGPRVGSTAMRVFSLDYAFRPEFILQHWVVFSGTTFIKNNNVKITCTDEVLSTTQGNTTEEEEEEEGAEETTESSPVSSEGPCTIHTCLHGGTCVPIEDGSFTCLCTQGFTGTHCQEASCGPPDDVIPHGRLTRVTSQGFLGLAFYSCDDGYVSSTGHVISVCGHSRRWLDKVTCIPSLRQLLEPVLPTLHKTIS